MQSNIGTEGMALDGALVEMSNSHGLVSTNQIQALLNLSPRPNFVCSSDKMAVLSPGCIKADGSCATLITEKIQ